ncbi:MAG: hypothetical protein Q9172_003662 [Xanthocarpia lactea]
MSLIQHAAAQVASSPPLASLDPPNYDDLTPAAATAPKTPPPPALHPRIAVLLGVSTSWHVPLLLARALSTAPAMWWGLRCAFTFLGDLLLSDGMGDPGGQWTVEKRFRVTEVFLAIVWCSASAYLSYFFTDCLMSRWLLYYTPSATVVRLLTMNALIAYITNCVLYLSGASQDPRMLLPAWVSIATTLTMLYHLSNRTINIRKETSASINVLSIASFLSLCTLLLQLHLTRDNDPTVPLFEMMRHTWDWVHRTL